MDDKDKDYHPFPHEEWCELLYTIEVKDNLNQATSQIKRLAESKE